ncbi:MAG: leucine-rich repeat protein [Clostridia bacterium]|nr:leucine-rich repeat protein [Clostridia bacterium]
MKKFFSAIISIIIMLCTLSVSAEVPPHPISWNISDGVLTISGQGPMDDYRNESDSPWYSERENISKICIEDGITHIGNLAFYGMTNAKELVIADSVTSIGLCAFSYTEGTVTTVAGLDSDYQFRIETDSAVVSKGDKFTISVILEADFEGITALQSTLLYDTKRISIDENAWYDTDWYQSIDDTNLGYISKPMVGFVANNLRLAYLSTNGTAIDDDCPLLSNGKTVQVIAKVNCTALEDIEDVNSSCFAIKDSAVVVKDKDTTASPLCGETQLTTVTRMPLPKLSALIPNTSPSSPSIDSKPEASDGNQIDGELTVMANGEKIEYDVNPYVNENGVIMLPIRFTLEAMGAGVTWDNDTQTAFAHYGDKFFAVQIGQKMVFTDEGAKNLDAVTIIKDTRTMVSMDCIDTVFEFDVKYAENTNTVTINSK